MQVLQERDLD